MARLFILCGPAFSGKTTVAREIVARLGAVYVGADEINARRGVNGAFAIPVEEWAECHRLVLVEVERALAAGATVVVDDTSCFRFLRDDLRAVASRLAAPSLIIALRTPDAEVLARARRNLSSPTRPSVQLAPLAEQLAHFEWPDRDEPSVDFQAGEDLAEWIARTLGAPGILTS